MAVPPPDDLITPGPIAADPAKPALRAALRARRAEHVARLGGSGAAAATARAAQILLPHIRPGMIVAPYLAFQDELDPAPLVRMLAERGQPLALPALLDRTTMVFRRWHPGDPLERGPFRLRQPPAAVAPVDPDIIVTPLVGFDRSGGRIGQGASHFDRAFARYPGARRLGYGWSVQEVERLPRDPWDVALHAVVTEKEFIAMPEADA